MKELLYGIVLVLIVGIAGFFYRNALERPDLPIACPVDAKICLDGSAVEREGSQCEFALCPPWTPIQEVSTTTQAITTATTTTEVEPVL